MDATKITKKVSKAPRKASEPEETSGELVLQTARFSQETQVGETSGTTEMMKPR